MDANERNALLADLDLFNAPNPAPGEPGYLTEEELAREWAILGERLGKEPHYWQSLRIPHNPRRSVAIGGFV